MSEADRKFLEETFIFCPKRKTIENLVRCPKCNWEDCSVKKKYVGLFRDWNKREEGQE